jgi:hypothetical protein
MADIIDQTDEREEFMETVRREQARRLAILAPGTPGECDLCGEWSARLVREACAPCRDKRRLP